MKGSIRKTASLRVIKSETQNKVSKQIEVHKIYSSGPISLKKTAWNNDFIHKKNGRRIKLGINA